MAITLTVTAPPVQQPTLQTEGCKMQRVQVAWSGTYVQGGDAITAAQMGLSSGIDFVIVDCVAESLGANKTCVAQWNPATGKIVVYGEDGTGASAGLPLVEMAAGATLTGLKANLLAFGV